MNHLGTQVLRLLFPQQVACHVCEGFTNHDYLCPACRAALLSLKITTGWENASGFLTRRAAILHYKEPAKTMVHLLKYERDYAAARVLGELLCTAFIPAPFPPVDLVLPVPLHPRRERKRGYNQAEWLASELCSHMKWTLRTDVLARVINTGSQTQHSRDERFIAMRNAFVVKEPAAVFQKRILLIDDVYTTGATTNACARELYASGAKEINLLTVCRA